MKKLGFYLWDITVRFRKDNKNRIMFQRTSSWFYKAFVGKRRDLPQGNLVENDHRAWIVGVFSSEPK